MKDVNWGKKNNEQIRQTNRETAFDKSYAETRYFLNIGLSVRMSSIDVNHAGGLILKAFGFFMKTR